MADTNGGYLARFERIEKILERMAEMQASIVEVQQAQAEKLFDHDRMLERIERGAG